IGAVGNPLSGGRAIPDEIGAVCASPWYYETACPLGFWRPLWGEIRMKLVRLFQERLSRRRRHRPARRPRFSQRFAADLVIKPLENRLVLSSGSVLQPELVLTLSGSGNLVISDAQGTHNDTVTLKSDTQHGQYVVTDPSQALDVSSVNGATLSPDG